MNPYHRAEDIKNKSRTKTIASIWMSGILVAAALTSGLLSIINSYQQATAQEEGLTSGDTTTITSTNATTMSEGEGGQAASSACAPTQTGDASNQTAGGGQNATTTMSGDGEGAATAAGINTTTIGGENQTTSEVRMHIEEACTAAHEGDMQGVLMHLNLALNALAGDTQLGNMTTTAATTAGPETSTGGGGTIEAGTAGDEPGTTEDEPETTGNGAP